MKVTTEKPEPGVAALTVEVPPEEFDRAVDQAWRRVSNRVNIPGFRRGKAPRVLVERHVGPAAINEEALRRLLPERYDAAVEETGIAPIERPSFDIVQLETGKPLVFKATVAVQPTVELGDYGTLEIEQETVSVSQEEVDRVLERLRESQAQWVPVEDRGLEMGDQAIADLKIEFAAEGDQPGPKTERKDSEVILGENGFPQGFDEQVLGARAGETRTFTLTWQVPRRGSEPGAEGEADEGEVQRTAEFTVAVKDVKHKQVPELSDDFAKSLGEHETLEGLVAEVRARLQEEALRAARVATENKAIEAAVAKGTFEVPERLIEAETESLVEERRRSMASQGITLERYLAVLGRDEAEWRAELREQALGRIKARVLLDAIAEKEGIAVTPQEVATEIERTAQSYGPQADQVRRSLQTKENRARVETSLRRQKALE
ncbi:MAG TPA: trigger factor, partial [Chloroflexota bacterium]|nr:trigger factor [Chloroflexota bacterium]